MIRKISLVFSTLMMILVSAVGFTATFQFKGDAFYSLPLVYDKGNSIVNAGGKDQFFFNDSEFIFNLYPTYTDKGLYASMKIQSNPFTTGTDYVLAKGFNLIYEQENQKLAMFVNRYAFRGSDPMSTGLAHLYGEYVNADYDTPVLFVFKKKVQNPAFYDLQEKLSPNEFQLAGQNLVGVYFGSTADLGYEFGGFYNKNLSSSHLFADMSYNILSLIKVGLLAQADINHAAGFADENYVKNMGTIFNGLTQNYVDNYTTIGLGLFAETTFSEDLVGFAQFNYKQGNGIPGNQNVANIRNTFELFAGIGTSMLVGTDLEITGLYRQIGTNSRIELAINDYNALDFDIFQIFLLGSVRFFMDSIDSATADQGLLATLSTRIPILDMFNFRLAASLKSVNSITNYSGLQFKTTVDYQLSETTLVYAGVAMYNVLSANLWTGIYRSSYLLPLAGIVHKPVDLISVVVSFGYDPYTFAYDYDGKSLENQLDDNNRTASFESGDEMYLADWLLTQVNPFINFSLMLKF